MIEPKDASKNDERQVKNKSNSLTHKRKGETRTMCIQGTKHWQLGMFFVVSLMLMVGLFSNTAPAHEVSDGDATTKIGRVTVTPKEVTAESMVDLVVKYVATKTLADPTADADTSSADTVEPTLGRIQVTLPDDWGPDGTATPIAGRIFLARQPGDRNATYVTVTKSGGVKLTSTPLAIAGDQATGWIINIDVTTMKPRHQVTLTIHNLMIAKLDEDRSGRATDITAMMDKLQVMVTSDAGEVHAAAPDHPPSTFTPKVTDGDASTTEDDMYPTVMVKRKMQGALTISPAEVTAGSEEDFTITYKATEALKMGEVIEVKLPAKWAKPEFNPDDPTKKFVIEDDPSTTGVDESKSKYSYVYLSGSASRLGGATIAVIQDDGTEVTGDGADYDGGWTVRITVGDKGVSRNSTIVLKYMDATVQRTVATGDNKLMIKAFSGASSGTDAADVPQYPVTEQAKDTITVKHAADGSGMVTFVLDDDTDVTGKKSPLSSSMLSVPAGLVKDDARSLIATYMPEGDMGAGEFEIRLPSSWKKYSVKDNVTVSGGASFKVSGNTVTAKFDAYFGEQVEDLVITFMDITVPNSHGNHAFLAKSKNAGGTLKQLSPRPMVFVGNTMADNDTVKVEITPEEAYVNQDDVDFEITLTASGPMHDSEIQITVPEGLTGLQTSDRAKANYVRKVSASVSGVMVTVDDLASEIISIETGKLNLNGKIKVRLENVDLEDASTDKEAGFIVDTKTRGEGITDPEDETKMVVDLESKSWERITKDDGSRSIVGGYIMTVEGSGKLAVEPATIEQGSRNKTFTLTFTATTDFPAAGLDLIIEVPDVIETNLQGDRSSNDGYVSTSTSKFHKDVEAADRLEVLGSTITWTKVVLNRGGKFITKIKRVDLLDETGDFRWDATLGGMPIPDKNNPAMVVVGTMQEDVAFEVVDESDITDSTPSYAASSMQSIRFKFTTDATAIQPGGKLWFTVPAGWSLPSLTDKASKATVGILDYDDDGDERFVTEIPHEGSEVDNKMTLKVSGRSVFLIIGPKGGLAADSSSSVTIRYGTGDLTKFPVRISSSAKGTTDSDEDGLAIRGRFRVSDDFRQRDAGTIWVDVTNVVDGSGTATLSTAPDTVRAGSKKNLITAEFTGTGTMDSGAVRFTIPEGWGAMQADPLELNHIDIKVTGPGAALTGYEIMVDSLAVEANLKTFGKGDKVTFTYGGGSGGRDKRGAVAQTDIGEATFMIESKGSGDDGDFVDIRDDDKDDSTDPLIIEVKGAEGGSGKGMVKIMASKSGLGLYDGETDTEKEILQVHAGDDSTYLVFTYTPSQTIAEGQLRFTVPGTWTSPQPDSTDDPGYTSFEEIDGAIVTNEKYDPDTKSVTADIVLTLDDKVKIHYGAENGGAGAPADIPTGGYSQFAIAVKSIIDDDVAFESKDDIDSEDLMVRVRPQRSGGGMAEVSPMTVNAGDMMPEITVTYTADGQVDDGQLKLTIPANWDAPTADNVMVKAMGSSNAAIGQAMYGAGRASTDLPEGLGAMDVIVDNVMLAGGDMVVFTYTSDMAQGTTGTAKFAIAADGGDGPGTGVKAVGGMDTVTVNEAGPGSGMATAMTDGIVLPGSTENTLTFTYTVAGEASYPADVRVAVPDGWTSVVPSNHTVTHKRAGRTQSSDMVQEKSPIDGAMVARVVSGEKVLGGDQIIFTFENVTAPTDAGAYAFEVTFRNQAIASHPMVIVQNAAASKLAIKAPSKVSGDASAAPAGITIMIQDVDGGAAAVADDVTVNLVSTNTSTGSFSKTADGDAMTMVTIPAGMSSVMVYYSDSRVGSTATILFSDDGGGLSTATTTIAVTTSVDAVTDVTVSPMLAKAGDTVTVSAKGTPGRTVMFSVDSIVTNRSMTEASTGSYSGSFMVVADQHADGNYTVTVSLNDESMTASLAIDSIAPTVSASASPATVGNGDTVTITATVDGATSVMADVSMLDSTQTNVTLTMAAAGAYSASVTISEDNEAVNGSKTITVTAMDAAGNSGTGTVMVMLDNKMSYTSTIPTGTSLFHVPLDQEGLDTVGDLKAMLGNAASLVIVSEGGSWNSRSDDVMITADLGLVLVMNAAKTVTFEGDAWGGGTSMITLAAGANLIGLPVNDPRVTNVSDIMGLFASGVVGSIIVSSGGSFQAVTAAGASGDGPVMGDAAYLVTATTAGTAAVLGKGWTNGGTTGAAPIALAGYQVEGQTPVLDVHGSIVDEITGLAKEGFRAKVKNLSTKASLNKVTSAETAEGYNMTFVDLKVGNAARIGDVLEISADSPNPLIGIKPVRHIVTVDDVKNSRIQLENLIAYEIPAETELLRNYPNPFNPETWIPYHLSEDADVNLTIYDINGDVVRDIDVGHQTAAKYDTRAKAIYWDGRNRFGEQVASGIYFYHLDAGDFSGTRKMVILK